MKHKLWLAAATVVLLSVAWAGPKGTVPRSTASQYPAHAEQDGVGMGARLLTTDEARKTFVSDLNRCCMVVEFAVYPEKEKSLTVSLDNLSLRMIGTETVAKASSATVVSAALQKSAQQQRDVTVSPTVGVGYGSGTAYDPATGTAHGGGVYTTAGVGVGIGGRGDQPGASDKDRSVIETELSEKSLPEGATASPVAGYVYFPIPRKKKANYQLQYGFNGNRVTLTLP